MYNPVEFESCCDHQHPSVVKSRDTIMVVVSTVIAFLLGVSLDWISFSHTVFSNLCTIYSLRFHREGGKRDMKKTVAVLGIIGVRSII